MRPYKIGDRVQIIDCAHPIWEPIEGTPSWQRRDLRPELVGQIGTVEMISNSEVQNIGWGKGIRFDDGGFSAWYYDWQLKLVEKAEYRILLKFWRYLNTNGFDNDEQIDTVINNFLNEQDGDRNNDS